MIKAVNNPEQADETSSQYLVSRSSQLYESLLSQHDETKAEQRTLDRQATDDPRAFTVALRQRGEFTVVERALLAKTGRLHKELILLRKEK